MEWKWSTTVTDSTRTGAGCLSRQFKNDQFVNGMKFLVFVATSCSGGVTQYALTDSLSVIDVADDFVDAKPGRKSVFGKFVTDDL